MLEKLLPEHVLFVDIETVPQYENLESVPGNLQKLWTKKLSKLGKRAILLKRFITGLVSTPNLERLSASLPGKYIAKGKNVPTG